MRCEIGGWFGVLGVLGGYGLGIWKLFMGGKADTQLTTSTRRPSGAKAARMLLRPIRLVLGLLLWPRRGSSPWVWAVLV